MQTLLTQVQAEVCHLTSIRSIPESLAVVREEFSNAESASKRNFWQEVYVAIQEYART